MTWDQTICSRNGKKQIEVHRSINIRCDDVLENLRKATPCFITGAFGQESWTADNSEQGQLVVFVGPGNASYRLQRAEYVMYFSNLLEIGIMTLLVVGKE